MPVTENMEPENTTTTETEAIRQSVAPAKESLGESVPVSPRKNKKVIITLLLITLIFGGGLFIVLSNSDESEDVASNDSESSEDVVNEVETKNVWMASYTDESGTKAYEISSDGTEQTEVETAWLQSQSGEYVAKETDKGIVVAPVSDLKNETVVFPLGGAESIGFVWFEDSDELLVRTYITANPEDDNGDYWIPVSDESVYVVEVEGGEPDKIYDHTETYGSLSLIGASRSRGEFYWSTGGEGGPRDAFNVSSLEDGSLIKKLASQTTDLYGSKAFSDGTIFSIGSGKIMSLDMTTGKETVLYDPGFAGLSDTPLNETCSVIHDFESVILGSNDNLIFSTVDNQKHQTTIEQFDIASKQVTKLYTFESVRQVTILGENDEHVLFARSRVNVCNNKSEEYEKTNLFVLNKSTSEVVDTGLSNDSQFYTGSASSVQLPL